MAISWCKVASNLDSHPKIRRAGRLGREVFLFALRRNAEPGNPQPGRIPADELEAWYVADQLMMSCDEAVTGVTSLVTVGLLAREGDWYLIVPWKDGWGRESRGGAERTAKWRENKKLQPVTSPNVTRDARDESKSHSDGGDTEEKRREESKSPDQRDVSLSAILILEIIRNNPRHSLARLSGPEKDKKLAKWANHVRLMREVDGHTEAEISAVIKWCQSDQFWRSNIMSTEKLREKWDTLVAQMGRAGKAPAAKQPAEQPKLTFMVGGIEVER